MSFDVFLQRFVNGESAQVDRGRVRQVLGAAKYHGPDDFGFYIVAFDDGVKVEFSADGLESGGPFDGCAFHLRGFGDGLMKFIFDVAQAGDMVIIPAMEGNLLVLVSEQQRENVPLDWKQLLQPIVVSSAGELGAVLGGGFPAWSAYRDQILRQSAADSNA